MKKALLSIFFLFSSILFIWWFLRIESQPVKSTSISVANSNSIARLTKSNGEPGLLATSTNQTTSRSQNPMKSNGVRLFKSTNYPPQTAEEKALWDWWDTHIKSEPDFRWKMPIEFYGKVVDQFGEPVANAEVVLNWTTVIGPIPDPKITIHSSADGRFEIKDIQGKGITVFVYRKGYNLTDEWTKNFEYADFFHEDFHVPDPNNPAVFRLHKIVDAEPFYAYPLHAKMTSGGPPLVINMETGKIESQGDLSFSLAIGTKTNRYGPEFSVTLQGHKGAGIVFSDEEFLNKAPESGYQSLVTVTKRADNPNYERLMVLHFYAKTGSGKYAAIGATVNLWNDPTKADFEAGIRLNPSGSRNLEYDQDKQINR
jgi:hypothetical protein